MSNEPDFTLYDRHGRPVAYIEVKNILDSSPEWAARFRQNLMAHDLFRGAKYLLFVTPDRLYFWAGQEAETSGSPTPPSYIGDGRAILGPYFARTTLSPDRISSPAFELLVLDWLGDLVHAQIPAQDWQRDSGLLDAIKGGRIGFAAAA